MVLGVQAALAAAAMGGNHTSLSPSGKLYSFSILLTNLTESSVLGELKEKAYFMHFPI
jgi:hypothetical protein